MKGWNLGLLIVMSWKRKGFGMAVGANGCTVVALGSCRMDHCMASPCGSVTQRLWVLHTCCSRSSLPVMMTCCYSTSKRKRQRESLVERRRRLVLVCVSLWQVRRSLMLRLFLFGIEARWQKLSCVTPVSPALWLMAGIYATVGPSTFFSNREMYYFFS